MWKMKSIPTSYQVVPHFLPLFNSWNINLAENKTKMDIWGVTVYMSIKIIIY